MTKNKQHNGGNAGGWFVFELRQMLKIEWSIFNGVFFPLVDSESDPRHVIVTVTVKVTANKSKIYYIICQNPDSVERNHRPFDHT